MAFATYQDLEDRLRVTFTAAEQVQATALLETATEVIKAAAGQTFDVVANDTVTLDGNGQTILVLPEAPVTAVASVTVDGTLLVHGTDYLWSPNGMLHRTASGFWGTWHGTWGDLPQSIVVVYTHGYATIPADLQVLCVELAARGWATTLAAGVVRQETIGSFSRTYAAGEESSGLALTDAELGLLAKYRRPVFA